MHILCVSPDVAPYGTSSAAKVSAGLSQALRHLNYDVTLLSPLYPSINTKELSLARRLDSIQVTQGQHTADFHVYDGRSASGVNTVFLENHSLFEQPYDPEEDSDEEKIVRMVLFAAAADQWLKERKDNFGLVHWHDWPLALGLVLCKHRHPDLPVVLSIYDLQYQGRLSEIMLSTLGLTHQPFSNDLVYGGSLNLLAAAVRSADRVLTTSTSQAKSILSEPSAHGLSRVLADRAMPPLGIHYGIDGSVWNPATDRLIAAPFDCSDLSGKLRCKTALQSLHALHLRAEAPLLVAVMPSGAAPDPSFMEMLTALLRNDAQLLLAQLHGGDVSSGFDSLRETFPDRFGVASVDTQAKEHGLLSGADLLLLLPGVGAPDLHFRAMRYGAVPIVHGASQLAEGVVDCDPRLETGTGFIYDDTDAPTLLSTCQRALGAFADHYTFRHLQKRIMQADHSWDRVARYYDQMTRELTMPPADSP